MQNLRAVPLGYQQLTSLSASTGLTVPTGAVFAIFAVETQNARWRDDGTAPTSTVGIKITTADSLYEYWGDLTKLRFIEITASAKLNVSYYGVSG